MQKRYFEIRRIAFNEVEQKIIDDLRGYPELQQRVSRRLAMVHAVADDLRGAKREVVATAYAETIDQALDFFYATADEPNERRLLPGIYTAIPK